MFKAALNSSPTNIGRLCQQQQQKQVCTLDWEDPEATSQRSARRNCVKNEDTEGRRMLSSLPLGVRSQL